MSLLWGCTNKKSLDYEFETSDINRFWGTYDTITALTDSAEIYRVFNEMYLDKASEGFKEIMKTCGDIRTPEYFIEHFELYPNFWESCRSSTLNIKKKKNKIDSVFKKFLDVFPNFKPPKVCIFMGTFSTVGQATNGWIVLGGEFVSYNSFFVVEEFNSKNKQSWEYQQVWNGFSFMKTSDISLIVAHETVHILQKKKPRGNVLENCIYEGVAEFVSEKISGIRNQTLYTSYGEEHERELWSEFLQDKNNQDISRWLYEGSNSGERPKDLGYYIGYKICESYFLSHTDSIKALQNMISISDYNEFFETSGYAKKFKK